MSFLEPFTRKCSVCGCFTPADYTATIDGAAFCSTCLPRPPAPVYRLAWKHRITGYEGHGEALSNVEVASEWVKLANVKYPVLLHWVEEVPAVGNGGAEEDGR